MTTATTPTDTAGRPTRSDDLYDVLTVMTLLLGGFLVPVVGWIAGVVLLWASPRWSTGRKWLGTLVWPAVVAVPLVAVGIGFAAGGPAGGGAWFVVAGVLAVLGVLVALPLVCVTLLRTSRTA